MGSGWNEWGAWVEFQNFGWNSLTVSLVGTVILTVVRSASYLSQARTIAVAGSGRSVPAAMYGYGFVSLSVCAVYGWRIGSLALVFGGTLTALANVPILHELGRANGGLGRGFWAVMAALSAVVLLFAWGGRWELMFLTFNFGAVPLVALQPYDIWRNRSAGAVDPSVLWVSLANAAFWVAYGLAIADRAIWLSNACSLAAFLVAVVLWFRFRHRISAVG